MEMKLILEIAEDKKLELSEKEAKDLFAKLQGMFDSSINAWVYPYTRWGDVQYYTTNGETTTYKVRMY